MKNVVIRRLVNLLHNSAPLFTAGLGHRALAMAAFRESDPTALLFLLPFNLQLLPRQACPPPITDALAGISCPPPGGGTLGPGLFLSYAACDKLATPDNLTTFQQPGTSPGV